MTNSINGPSVPASPAAPTPAARQASQSGAAVERQAVAAIGTSGGTSAPAPAIRQPSAQAAQTLSDATRDISEYIQSVSRSLSISVDGDLGTTVIQVRDAETEELVRQIPAEEILQIARFLSDQQASSEQADSLRGLLVDQQG